MIIYIIMCSAVTHRVSGRFGGGGSLDAESIIANFFMSEMTTGMLLWYGKVASE